jgi:hypothetical protein
MVVDTRPGYPESWDAIPIVGTLLLLTLTKGDDKIKTLRLSMKWEVESISFSAGTMTGHCMSILADFKSVGDYPTVLSCQGDRFCCRSMRLYHLQLAFCSQSIGFIIV